MKVLLVGGGGREHALAWKIRQSPLVEALFAAPGNAGIAADAECVSLDINDPRAVAAWSEERGIGLVVVGPEAPLVAGLADELARRSIATFGPSAAAAEIEGSKVFAKEFMARHDIPTARFRVFSAAEEAKGFLRSECADVRIVVKADGLAAGKGLFVCEDRQQAFEAVDRTMVRREFGAAGDRVVIEERLEGREASFFALTDGRRALPLDTCQDYKRVGDGDTGPNTGGMGGFSPSPFLDAATRDGVMKRIVLPTLAGLAADGRPFRGVLYVGLMLTEQGPRVLEYNARFGDPETQALMPRLASDLVPVLLASARGDLGEVSLEWRHEPSVCVVLASEGYPGRPRTGCPIEGLDRLDRREGISVFHAGTSRDPNGRIVTAGGRVLAVVATGAGLPSARERCYEAAAEIRFAGAHHRTDIAST
jgi:phosphoribosylamine--glycine ligase